MDVVVDEGAQAASELAFLRTWNRDLKEIDPYLELVKAKPQVTAQGLRPGFWHVIRRNPGAPTCRVLVVETPEGEYKEPDSSLFDELRKNDMWDDRTVRARERRSRLFEEAEVRREERERQERVDNMELHLKSIVNPGVSMTSARPWTYRTGNR